MTAIDGEPLAIRVFEGNTGDTQTLNEAIKVVADRLEVRDLVFVGDRGMIKSTGHKQLKERGFRFLTALTNAQVRKLVKAGELSLDHFLDEPQEANLSNGPRLILRRNPKRQARDRQRRQNQLIRVQGKVDQRNAQLRESSRAQPAVSLRQANTLLQTYRLHRFVDAKLEGREVSLVVNEEGLSEVSRLDAC